MTGLGSISGGGTLVLAGTSGSSIGLCSTASGITLTSDQTLVGLGQATLVTANGTAPITSTNSTSTTVQATASMDAVVSVASSAQNVGIMSMTVDAATTLAGHGIHVLPGAGSVSITAIEVENATDNGLKVEGASHVSVTNTGTLMNYFHGSCHAGIYVVGELVDPGSMGTNYSTRSSYAKVIKNFVINNGNTGQSICGENRSDTQPDAVDIDRMTDDATVSGNVVETGDIILYDDGEQVDGVNTGKLQFSSFNHTIENNLVINSNKNEIDIIGCEGFFVVQNNTIENISTQYGMTVNGPAFASTGTLSLISGNVFQGPSAGAAGVQKDAVMVDKDVYSSCTLYPITHPGETFGVTGDCGHLDHSPIQISFTLNSVASGTVPSGYYCLVLDGGADTINVSGNTLEGMGNAEIDEITVGGSVTIGTNY